MTKFENQLELDRRKYPRIFFSVDDEVAASITTPNTNNLPPFHAKVMDLSLGGLFFTIKRGELLPINEGDFLLLKDIIAFFQFRITCEIEMKVKRVQDHQFIEYIGFGCEFISPPPETEEQIRNLLNLIHRKDQKIKA
ncbi:MAG: PilZ domain-containing protein [Proteobacteria bacterium]|nr:PilZ domain-containing protein [Pseudomonadota bacterium]MBU1686536.1 PilZ domain-containing protein [Pseudomonadota bacterium]